MLENRYLVKIEGKDPHRFLLNLIKMNFQFYRVKEKSSSLELLLNEANYQRLMEMKTIYQITLKRIYGPKALWQQIWNKRIFWVAFLLGCLVFFLLTHIIFSVEVIHTKKAIRDMLYEELAQYGITRFHFCVSFEQKEKIRSEILAKHKDTLEWMEIERIGTKYVVRVEERMLNDPTETPTVRDIVARKDGIITRIEASQGEIVAKKDQYVRKGDLLITGVIHNKEEAQAYVMAKGNVYAETWYKVTVAMPLHYHEEKATGKKTQLLQVHFLNHTFSLFDFAHYKNKKSTVTNLLKNPLFPLSFDYVVEQEMDVIDENYTPEEATQKANEMAASKVLEQLNVNGRILQQKDLKITQEDSKIVIEVFLKVEEDITDFRPIVIPNQESSEE